MRSRGKSILVIALFALLFGSVFMASAPVANAQVHLLPTLSISTMNPASVEVTVTPSSIGSAAFTATVEVSKPPAVGIVTVNLDASCSAGWQTVVSPATLPFTSPGSQQIQVIVTVPQAVSTQIQGKVTVTGIATWPGGGQTATSSAMVIVKQYFRMAPMSPTAFMATPPGTQFMLQLDIWNRGNGLDTFTFDIQNLKTLNDKNWLLGYSSVSVDNVVQDEYDTIKITVKPEKPWVLSYAHGDANYIKVRIKSENAEIEGIPITKDYVFAILIEGFYVPGFDIGFVLLAFGMISVFVFKHKEKKRFRKR